MKINGKYVFTEDEKQKIVNDYVNNYLSIKDIVKKYEIKSKGRISEILGDNVRSASEATKIAHKKYPERFKHSEETKNLMRKKRLQYMKENPEKTAWRQTNISYPEKCFKKLLIDNEFNKNYLIIREYSIYPYFIDFAFIDLKLAVEIDGSQHLLEERKIKDGEKDKLLINNGWSVLRFTAYDIVHNKELVLSKLKETIGNNEQIYEKVGILKTPKTRIYKRKERGEDGLTDKQRKAAFNQRVVERPSKEFLSGLIKQKTFVEIGEKYGVSDSAVRKWCKTYGLLYRKRDISPKIITYCKHCGSKMSEEAKGDECLKCIRSKTITKLELKELSIKHNWDRYKIADELGFNESYIRQLWKRYKLKITK